MAKVGPRRDEMLPVYQSSESLKEWCAGISKIGECLQSGEAKALRRAYEKRCTRQKHQRHKHRFIEGHIEDLCLLPSAKGGLNRHPGQEPHRMIGRVQHQNLATNVKVLANVCRTLAADTTTAS